MDYRLVLWDFDGTLADTLRLAVAIYNRIAPRHKALPMTNPEEMRGFTMPQLMRLHRIRCHRFPALLRDFLAEQSRTMREVRLHPGILETIEALTQAGVRQGIVSSNSEANIRICLEHHRVQDHFEFVVGIRRLFGKKRALKKALKQAGSLPSESLYIGDEVRDIRAARQIRMPVACVTWGVNSPSLLESHSPDHLISEPQQLLPLFAISQVTPPERSG